MKIIFRHIRGDKTIWAIIVALSIFSFMPIYSASAGLANSNVGTSLAKHVLLLALGLMITYSVHKIPYRYFSLGSVIMLPIVIVLLFFTLTQETVIAGANASRWLKLPFVGFGFQTSTLASLVLMIYTARYMARNRDKEIVFKESVSELWLPVALVLGLVLSANFSTAAIIFSMVIIITFIGGYPLKYIGIVLVTGFVALLLFILVIKAFPSISNRVDTWQSRIENKEESYQVKKAKIAIATGGLLGVGPGKSIQKNFLPQSSSDFIFAIIVEEYGLIGTSVIVFLYFLLLFRIFIVIRKTISVLGILIVLSAGLPILFQAIVNMAVATNLLPVTGQTLPLISSGGSSIWMTCFALGIILSVSASIENKEEISEENPLHILHETID